MVPYSYHEEIPHQEIEDLGYFGLSVEEATVYISLLKRGNRGEVVGRIKDELQIGRTTIYAIMERLTEKKWVESIEISNSPKRIKYVANAPSKVFNSIIETREEELKTLKKTSLLIGDKLEKDYQGAKKLTIDTIHFGGYKYLKPLVDQGWKIKTEVIEFLESQERLALDYELKGSKGFPKDSGLVIIIFNRDIENDANVIDEAFEMLKIKSEYEIQRDKIPGLDSVVLKDDLTKDYKCADVLIKLKIKKKLWLVGKEAVIAFKNRLFLFHGNLQNFETLLETIKKAESFHHLVQ